MRPDSIRDATLPARQSQPPAPPPVVHDGELGADLREIDRRLTLCLLAIDAISPETTEHGYD